MTQIIALGAGRMGRGIAHAFAYAGHPVTILDFKDRPSVESEHLLAEAKAEVAENLEFLVGLGMVTAASMAATLDRVFVAPYSEAATLLANASYVFEGVPETLAAKEDALRRASAMAGVDTVIASTSSTMLANDLCAFSENPNNFLNAHFLNPAYLIPLVEVSPSDHTEDAVLTRFNEFLEGISKVPIVCRNSPGYIVARLQSLAMSESIRMVEEGVATAEDIDRAVRVGYGVRYATMGFIEFTDWGGVDILYHANKYLSGALGERFASPAIVDEYMAAGKLGLKSGEGFYDFKKIDPVAYRREKLATFIGLLGHLDLLPVAADGEAE